VWHITRPSLSRESHNVKSIIPPIRIESVFIEEEFQATPLTEEESLPSFVKSTQSTLQLTSSVLFSASLSPISQLLSIVVDLINVSKRNKINNTRNSNH